MAAALNDTVEAMLDAVFEQARALDLMDERAVDRLTDKLASAVDDDERVRQQTALLEEWQPRVLAAMCRESDKTAASLIRLCKAPCCSGEELAAITATLLGDTSGIENKSLKTLKAIITGAGLSASDCTEKSEFIARATEALKKGVAATLDAPLMAIVNKCDKLIETASSTMEWLNENRTEIDVSVRRTMKGGIGIMIDDFRIIASFRGVEADLNKDILQKGDKIVKIGGEPYVPETQIKKYVDNLGLEPGADIPMTVARLPERPPGFCGERGEGLCGTVFGYVLRAGSATSYTALTSLDPYEPVPILLLSPDGERMGVAGPLAPADLLGLDAQFEKGSKAAALTAVALKTDFRSKKELGKMGRLKADMCLSSPTLLQLACHANNGEAVKALAAAGADVEKVEVGDEGEKRSPMRLATEFDSCDAIRALHAAGASLTSTHEFSGATPLHVAAQKNHMRAVELLLELGAPTKVKTLNKQGGMGGSTPLHLAVAYNSIESVRLLIAKGADKAALTQDGHAAVSLAANSGNPVLLDALTPTAEEVVAPARDGTTAAVLAARIGYVEMLKRLVEINPSCLKTRVDGGQTLLMKAIIGKRFARSSQEYDGENGKRPLDAVKAIDLDATINFLLEQPGIDIHARSIDGATPLFLAGGAGDVDLVKRLANAGADLNTRDAGGQPAIHYAAASGEMKCVQALYDLGADVHTLNTESDASIVMQVISAIGKYEGCTTESCIEMLPKFKEWDVDFTVPDKGGWTPALLAALKRNVKVLRCLHGLDVALDQKGTIIPVRKGDLQSNTRLAVDDIPEEILKMGRGVTPAMAAIGKVEQSISDGSGFVTGVEDLVNVLDFLYECGAITPAGLSSLLKHGGLPPPDSLSREDIFSFADITEAAPREPDFPRALLRAMSAITADVNVQSRGLIWLGECSDADDEFRVVAAPIIAAAMRAHPDILRVQLLAVQSIHALIANGKMEVPTIREAVLAAGLARLTATAMERFQPMEWEHAETLQSKGCAVFWCHNDGGCQQAVLEVDGVKMIIQAAMYCMASGDFNDRMKTFWLGSLNSMIKGPPNVQIAVALGAMGQINSLMQQLQHQECPEHAKLDIRNLVFLLTAFLGNAATDEESADNGFNLVLRQIKYQFGPNAPQMTFTKTVVMLMRYFEEDEDFMDMAGFLPEYIDHAAMRKEAVKAGAKPDWLDPNGSHARVHKMIKEKMSEAEAAKRARRANGEESDDDDDEDDDGDQGNDDDDDEEDGVPPEGNYRFSVGTKVRCLVGPTQWKVGVIVALNYREADWPTGAYAAYQVKLREGQLIYAPVDLDDCIRAA